jgi:tripartite-type tricarboxylate transporter receptor subunit TctC
MQPFVFYALVRRTLLALIVAFGSLAGGPASSTYPERPVRIILGYPTGDTTDLVTRIVAPALAEFFKQPFIVDNHPGANGNLATVRASKAKPDGQTLLLVSSSFSANASLYPGLTSHPLRDFVPISRVAVVHYVLIVQPSLGVTKLADFLAAIRASPGKMSFASAGTGSMSHLVAELMKVRAGPLNTLHVPYKGSIPALADLIGGHVNALFVTMPYAYPQVRSGRVRALAVASLKRAALLPEVPTFEESGVLGVDAPAWNAIVAPAGTPYDTMVRLNLGVANVESSPVIKEKLAALGAEGASDTADQFTAYLRAEVEKWAKVIKAASVVVE